MAALALTHLLHRTVPKIAHMHLQVMPRTTWTQTHHGHAVCQNLVDNTLGTAQDMVHDQMPSVMDSGSIPFVVCQVTPQCEHRQKLDPLILLENFTPPPQRRSGSFAARKRFLSKHSPLTRSNGLMQAQAPNEFGDLLMSFSFRTPSSVVMVPVRVLRRLSSQCAQ